MKMAKYFCLLVLVGCATPAERAQMMEHEVEEMMQVFGPACERMGYATKTDAWRNCVLQLNQQDIERNKGKTSCVRQGRYWSCAPW